MGILKDAFGIGVKVFKGARSALRAKRASKKAKRLAKKASSADAATSALLSKLGLATGIPNVNNFEGSDLQKTVFPESSKTLSDTSDSYGDDGNDTGVQAKFASLRKDVSKGVPKWVWWLVGGVLTLISIIVTIVSLSRKRR